MSKIKVAGPWGVRVMGEQCPTCIFRPGNLMDLNPGRVAGMIADVKRDDGCIPCHEVMHSDTPAICRGQFDKVKTPTLQIAERVGAIVWREP